MRYSKLILIIGAATLATGAAAQDVSITVLSVSASDVRDDTALKGRIKAAIDRGCGVPSAEPYAEWTSIARCRKAAFSDVDRQLHRLPELKGEGIEIAMRR